MAEFKWKPGSRQKVMAALRKGAIDGLVKGAGVTQFEVKKKLTSSGASNIGSGGMSGPRGRPPRTDTGGLFNSIQVDDSGLKETSNDLRVRIGTGLPYARIHEFGGVIKAKKVKALPVPIRSQSLRAKQLRRKAGTTLKNLPPGTLIPMRAKSGVILLAERQGAKLVPIFVLKKSVRIPKRPYMRPGFNVARPQIPKQISGSIQSAVRGIGA